MPTSVTESSVQHLPEINSLINVQPLMVSLFLLLLLRITFLGFQHMTISSFLGPYLLSFPFPSFPQLSLQLLLHIHQTVISISISSSLGLFPTLKISSSPNNNNSIPEFTWKGYGKQKSVITASV